MLQGAVVELAGVSKWFSSQGKPAVADVSFQLPKGDLLGLLGPSGCGKTTLLRLIAGFEQPQTGRICLGDQQVAGVGIWIPPERRDVGLVFQDFALFPHLTVAENVGFGLTTRQTETKRRQKRIHEVLELVALQGLDKRYPHELSGGQQQRVALARALAPHPAVILLDEPLSNLDVQVRLYLREEIRKVLKQTGTSGIFVTHDQEEALAISDWVAVMSDGRIEQLDSPENIYWQPTSRFVAEFVTQANFLPATWQGSHWQTEVGNFPAQGEATVLSGEVMIRQEDLLLQPDPDGRVVIRDRQFLGREYAYCLATGTGRELHVRSCRSLAVGSRVQLSVDQVKYQVFANQT
ncbi:MAG: ABC transporter ATP-binding protein [Cyanobacteriota bacterium]|nr:ABC transporter ATP-binding protein [Cyanobacteriota bacterium]